MPATEDASKQTAIDEFNANMPECQKLLGALLTDFDLEEQTACMTFDIPQVMCHSGNIVQGGYVAAMLDAVTYFAARINTPDLRALATLELKVSYLEQSNLGQFRATGQLIKAGKSIAFLEGKLCNPDGKITATVTTTAKLIRQR